MYMWKRIVLISFITASFLTLVVVAALSDSLDFKTLTVPLFEVGEFCKHAVSTVTTDGWSDLLARNYLDFFLLFRIGVYATLAYVTISILRWLHQFLFCTMDRTRVLGTTGYVPDGVLSMKEIANGVRRRRRVGDIPPVYPNGWFGLIESHKLAIRQTVPISILGLNLALFRDEKGNAHALNAYCPHLGAHLAVGGRVLGNCIECPFHGWRFRGDDGKCVYIPYADKIPDVAQVKSWPIQDVNGWIYLWYHAEGLEPTWLIPEIEDIVKGNWTYKGRTEHHVNAHIEEIPLNGADVIHLNQVHGPGLVAGVDLRHMYTRFWEFIKHIWTATWEPYPPPDGHLASITLKHCLNLCGVPFKMLNLDVFARQIGPAIVYLEFQSIFGKGIYIQSVIPTEPMVQKVVHNIYVSKSVPTLFAKFLLLAEAIQFERDIMIWNNKQYQHKPVFVKSKEDSLMMRHRRWFSQFYSENSPRMTFQKESLDW
ncbi:cholesterol 7-desaturase nvd [Octopus bimaculoides]|uniref:cholesterol 7-desaturase nvd n=1 Tax=Octopus bimaculoides TaxID=37653 RepID=UPI0022DEE562|nr:cholesterol 7-desaturase nvd [Octopus bimaculoides]